MKKEKQLKVLEILKCGHYKVDPENGLIYYYKKGTDSWNEIVGSNINGYKQVNLRYLSRRGNGYNVLVYAHHVVYLSVFGEYDPEMEINHIDHVRDNNAINNLQLTTKSKNICHSRRRERLRSGGNGKFVTPGMINKIAELARSGYSQSRIAREMNINRLTARWHIINSVPKLAASKQ